MNCREIERLLAEGAPLTAEMRRHVAGCPGCSSLVEALDGAMANLDRVPARGVQTPVLPALTKIKPLASDSVLISTTMGGFVLFCLIVTVPFGFGGFGRLTPFERLAYYGPVTFSALLFCMAAVQGAIPGARVRVRRGLVIAGTVVVLSLLVLMLFPASGTDRFVARGVPCLRLGCVCAALFGGLAAIALRRGYVTDIRAMSLLLGCFAGFSGVAVLSLHCAIFSAFHIIVWHLGAIAISALAGLFVGMLVLKRT